MSRKQPFKPSERHLAAIVESSDDAIVTKSLDGIITSWNAGAQKIFGYTAEEAVGRPISLIIPPDRAAEEIEILARLRKGERIDHFETIRMHKDGRPIQVSLTISPVKSESGEIIGASKIARDISERKRSEDSIRLEREKLKATLTSIGDAVIVTDARGIVDFLNPIAEKLTGWPLDEAVGKPLESVFCIVNEQSGTRVESPTTLAIRDGAVIGLANHTLLIARDGTELAIDDSAAPIKDRNGSVSGVILVFRDVTGTRAVNDFRERLSAIVESSDDAIIGKNLEGRITSWNKGAERIFGFSQAEALGRPITMLIPADRLGEESEILNRLKQGYRVDHFETVRVRKDGSLVDVSLTISPIRDHEGNIVGASKIARDITEKKKTELELQQANLRLAEHSEHLERMVNQRTAELKNSLEDIEAFSSGLSHDLRGPLRTICGFTNVLIEDYSTSLPPDGQKALGTIRSACERMTQLIDSVLSYSRLGHGTLRKQSLELAPIIARVLQDYPDLGQANAEVTILKPLLTVQADELLLYQVLANLLSNAVKFIPKGTRPKVRIWTERVPEGIRLLVKDNGLGIEKEHQQEIFKLFTRKADTTYEGTGIGLAIVQRAMRRMGGSVGVESEPGSGSTFWVQFHDPPQSQTPTSSAPSPA